MSRTPAEAALARVLPPISVGGPGGGWLFDEDETARTIVVALREAGYAIEAQARTAVPEIDVERLARAMLVAGLGWVDNDVEATARAVASAYAATAPQEPE